jgi:muramoyltetrapeptide carboxypeptidase
LNADLKQDLICAEDIVMKIPPYLQKGDTIGIVAPAGYMPLEKMETCIATLETWGYNVVLGQTTHSSSSNYFSAPDDERIRDLQEMLDNKEIKAILCARGGYGMSRMVDKINFKKFRKNPKWIIGYSDITVLHAHLCSNYKIASLHAPMAAAFNDGGFSDPYIGSLKNAIEGIPAEYECAAHEFNSPGNVKGELVGGNLSLLAHITGSRSDFETKNKILFVEDVGEYLYNIDRMFLQLKRSGKLKKLAGLIIGGFTDSKDTERPFGMTAYEIIHEHIIEYDYPVCFGFPVSHEKENYALKVGGLYKLSIEAERTALKE